MTKIMVVEDDNSLREIYSIRLTAENYEVVSAGDGEEALAVAVKERPDLILSDVMMPKISGFDMLDILRQTPETMNIKVIMMTALSSDDQRQRGEGLGADKYLVKSQVGIEDVINAIHEVLGDKATTQGGVNTPAQTTPQASVAPAPTTAQVPQNIAPTQAPAPVAPQITEMPIAPVAQEAPVAPAETVAPQMSATPVMPEVPAMPAESVAPAMPAEPVAPAMPTEPVAPEAQQTSSMPTMNPVAPVAPAMPNNIPQANESVPELDAVAAELSAQQSMIDSVKPEENTNLTV